MTDTAAATPDFDIAIVGAGPVGLALANWLLRDTDWRIALFDARDAEAALPLRSEVWIAIMPLVPRPWRVYSE
ncbi:hypothetical protein ACQCS2_24345, partial [Ralstonia pseudosolanacearum]